ncbi:MAG: hypothetical protein WA814_09490, partial [Candidatus Baltobacteraceae bacterium]
MTVTAPHPSSIKELAVRRALELGAGDVRVAPAFADDQTRRRMVASFARGDLASWGYTSAYARRASDPGDVLRGARSVICVALPYATPAPAEHAPL